MAGERRVILTVMRARVVGWALLLAGLAVPVACASDEPESEPVPSCVPGQQASCACPGGGAQGVQVCQKDGTYGECLSCAGGPGVWPTNPDGGGSGGTSAGGTGGSATGGTSTGASGGTTATGGTGNTGPCANHCSNGTQDCGEANVDCGGDCPPTSKYTWCDCLFDTPRNGSEVCDDSGFAVPSNPPAGVLVCIEPAGGVIYLATNTAIDTDGVQRCSGWENKGQNPWDHLNYIAKLDCDAAQKTVDVDVSAYVGETLWFGAHDQPTGGGKGTTACIAVKK